MRAQDAGGAEELLGYQIELHKKLKMERMIRAEKRLKEKYEAARRTFGALGLNPDRVPYPTMDREIKIRRVEEEEIIKSVEKEQNNERYMTAEEETRKIYEEICKSLVPKTHKVLLSVISAKQNQHRKISTVCQREYKRALLKTSKTNPFLKGKRVTKELQLFFKRTERTNREKKKKEEREDYDRRKKEEEEREEERQAKKLDFLITQTELFSHFILGKKQNVEMDEHSKIAMEAAEKHKKTLREFEKPGKQEKEAGRDRDTERTSRDAGAADLPVYNNSVLPISESVKVPKILKCDLKEYQKRGLEWLVSLYDQGINGLLADEMGLGKTVQTISFLAHLAESKKMWGPFLVITPSSTLHNWEQEIKKFVPGFRVLSYWGTVADRKGLRKNWQQRKLQREDSPFHVVITSYQLAVTDEKQFNKIKWQYMVLDEAQAIKSSTSTRWKVLLSFKSRNRLLLTGTPIQNTLQELWALLHFIMPTLFDSHGEFSEWFKIEDGDSVTEAARLRMVLQPFMLRREKKDVADELGKKVEKTIVCGLSPKQKRLYGWIKSRAPMASFLESAIPDNIEGVEGLMNLVMQFRKVCNHPDLFEKREAAAGWTAPVQEIYVPQVVVDKVINRRRCLPDALLVDVEEMSGAGEEWTVASYRKPSNKKAKIEEIRDVIVDADGRESVVKMVEGVVVPKCLPARQEVVSPGFIAPPETAPAEVVREVPGPNIYVPSMERFVSDSGKLCVLDALLPKLKEEGHRVLMYFQMTRMIDLFENYLTVRNYSYLRLDGSSKISNRRELVKDWQSNSDRFIFLLSTRAGGLGINLTAADTVIFYDSDWNPTADQQAMDRAHRLGQTKQVTVYRLITAGTIEERIMERAGVKGEIQRMVIKTRD